MILLWPLTGIVWYTIVCCRMKTWCGDPISEQPLTYMMYLLAAMLGPALIIILPLPSEDRP